MKQNLLKKWLMTVAFIFFVLFVSSTHAQSIKRQCISAYGSVVYTDNITISQTAGQSYCTSGVDGNTANTLQGFQQPNTYSIENYAYTPLSLVEINVYPNPASYTFTISSAIEIDDAAISVMDASGNQIIGEQYSSLLEHTINCREWNAGVYLITISDSHQNRKTVQIIVSK